MRRHPGRPDGCWHEYDRDDQHALGDHRDCLPGVAEPLGDDDPHGDMYDGDGPDTCRWAARWRAAAVALAAGTTDARPLAVVALDPATGPRLVGLHGTYRTAGPHRTRTGRQPGDEVMAEAKSRALVICALGHLH